MTFRIKDCPELIITTHLSKAEQIGKTASKAQELAIETEKRTGIRVAVVLVTTDGNSNATMLRNPNEPQWQQVLKARAEQLEEAITGFDRVFLISPYDLWQLLQKVNRPDDCPLGWWLGGNAPDSSYQCPKLYYALLRISHPGSLVIQVDNDAFLNVVAVSLAAVAVFLAARKAPGAVVSGGYSLQSEWDAASSDPALLRALCLDGTTARVGQLAEARHLLSAESQAFALIDGELAKRFLDTISELGADPWGLAAGACCCIPAKSSVPPYPVDRCMTWGSDDCADAEMRAVKDGVSKQRVDVKVPQQRHKTGGPSVENVVWHARHYVPRLVGGLSFLAATRSGIFQSCLRVDREPSPEEQQLLWEVIRDKAAVSASRFTEFEGTVLGVISQGPSNELFAALSDRRNVGNAYAPNGLLQTMKCLPKCLPDAHCQQEDSAAYRLAMVVEDLSLWLSAPWRRVWEDLINAAKDA